MDELLEVLDRDKWERHLVMAIEEMRDDILRLMQLTEDLTLELKGNKKSVLEIETGMTNLSLSVGYTF